MLICPEPLPDELDRGYLGRAMRWNGVNRKELFYQMVTDWSGSVNKSRFEAPKIELLAKMANLDVPQFAQRHTTLPLRRGIVEIVSDVHGSQTERSLLWSSGIRLARDGAYFCKDCVHEDQWFHGHSYWRREHQIPGLLWCPKHLKPLNYVEDTTAFFSSPAEYADQSKAFPDELVSMALENMYIRRYLEICSGIMERDTPLIGRQVSGVLISRASKLGYRTARAKEIQRLLSDAVISAFGRSWLAGVLPSLSGKPVGVFHRSFDNVLSWDKLTCKVYAYILACSVLFESSDSALNAITNRASRKPTHRATPEAKMIETYISMHGNYLMTSEALLMKHNHVVSRLRAMNLPNILEPVATNVARAVVAFFHEGLSFSESASKSGVSLESLERLIRKPNAIRISTSKNKPPLPGKHCRADPLPHMDDTDVQKVAQ